MLHDSTQTLIRKLCELTESGVIAWREGDGQRSLFDTEGYVVEVMADPPTVRVIDDKGRELECASAVDLRATLWPGDTSSYGDQVVRMADRAHRIARGAERAISKILSSLSAPPQKAPETVTEPEPIPCAPEFEPPVETGRRISVSAGESDADLAAIAADMAQTPPPAPPLVVKAEPAAKPPMAAPVPEPAPAAPIAKVEPPAAAMAPSSPATPPVAPATRPVHVLSADGSVRAPSNAPQRNQPMFGAITTFVRVQPKPASLPPPKMTSSGLLVTGIHAVSRQVVGTNPMPVTRPAGAARIDAKNVYKPWG
jgi:hypothetical protein